MKSKFTLQAVLIHLFTILVLAVCASTARADIATWTGGGLNNDWFTPANWSSGTVPTLTTDAYINNGAKVVINQSGAVAHSLTLGSNVSDSGALTVDGGTLTTAAAGNDEDPAPVQGAIYVGNAGKGTLNIIHGGIVMSGYGYIAASAGQLAVSNGTVSVDGASSSWTMSSSGTEVLSVGGVGGTNGGTGLLSITNGGLVTVNHNNGSAYAARVLSSGTLTGNSTIAITGPNEYAASLVINGTITPTRKLTIDGILLYVLGTNSTATTVCDVMSSDDPNETHIDVDDEATLSGRLIVTMTGTFTPGTQFLLLHADDGLNGTKFASYSITYTPDPRFTPIIVYDTNNVYLELQSNE